MASVNAPKDIAFARIARKPEADFAMDCSRAVEVSTQGRGKSRCSKSRDALGVTSDLDKGCRAAADVPKTKSKRASRHHPVVKVNYFKPDRPSHISRSSQETQQPIAHKDTYVPANQSNSNMSVTNRGHQRYYGGGFGRKKQQHAYSGSIGNESYSSEFTVQKAAIPHPRSRGYQPAKIHDPLSATTQFSNTVSSSGRFKAPTVASAATTPSSPKAGVEPPQSLVMSTAFNGKGLVEVSRFDVGSTGHHDPQPAKSMPAGSQSDGADDGKRSVEIILDKDDTPGFGAKKLSCWSVTGDFDANQINTLGSLKEDTPDWMKTTEEVHGVRRTHDINLNRYRYRHPDERKVRKSPIQDSYSRQISFFKENRPINSTAMSNGSTKRVASNKDFTKLNTESQSTPLRTSTPCEISQGVTGKTEPDNPKPSLTKGPWSAKTLPAEPIPSVADKIFKTEETDASKQGHLSTQVETAAPESPTLSNGKKQDETAKFLEKLQQATFHFHRQSWRSTDAKPGDRPSKNDNSKMEDSSPASPKAATTESITINMTSSKPADLNVKLSSPESVITQQEPARLKESNVRLTSDIRKEFSTPAEMGGSGISNTNDKSRVEVTIDEKAVDALQPKEGGSTGMKSSKPKERLSSEETSKPLEHVVDSADIATKTPPRNKQRDGKEQHVLKRKSTSKASGSPQSQVDGGITIPIGDSWNVRPAYHNPAERKAVINAFASEQANSVRGSVDVSSPEFLNGLPVLEEDEDQVILDKSSSRNSKPWLMRPWGSLNTTKENIEEHSIKQKLKTSNPNMSLLPDPRKMTKEQHQQLKELMTADENTPNIHAPKANIYLRPAELGDAKGITDIWNWHVKNTMLPIIDTDEPSFWRDEIGSTGVSNNPFVVAVLKKGKSKRHRRERSEFIVGFGRTFDYGAPTNAYRFTLEMEIFVHQDLFHQGVGKTLFDRLMMSVVDSPYIAKYGVEFLADNPERYELGNFRRAKKIIVSVYYSDDDETVEWKSSFLKSQNFEQFAHLPNAGFKNGKMLVSDCEIHCLC